MTPSNKPPKVPAPKKTASSGQHPAVREYRKKLDSVDERVTAATSELDRKLREFLEQDALCASKP